jgi:hypothetical protein
MFRLKSLPAILLCVALGFPAAAQVETVPVNHPVYTFLKRMEVRGLIDHYHDAILPISRKEVAGFLQLLNRRKEELTSAEQGWLEDFLSEFQYDITGTIRGFNSLISTGEESEESGFSQFFSSREKYLYAYRDSALSFFVNGLLTFDARRITGDALGREHAEFVQGGGRIRGTIYGRLGYSLQGTNAQFWGSRDLLLRDRLISQTHAITTGDAQNFDMSEGYVRYDGGIVSAQIGTERVLWGNGYDQQMILSDNVRTFPFIRAEAQYKSLKYSFLHGWLLGNRSYLHFSPLPDSSVTFVEPITDDKYIVAHRLEFSFPHLFDIGGQEVLIYSNRAPDLAYFNPLIVLESAQRSRDERDNNSWSFDIQTHFMKGLELQATVFFDDLHFAEFFKSRWYNRYAYQAGLFLTDPLMLPNTSVMVEWTRVDPYVFAHDRSRDDSFTSAGAILGPRIGPNADSWFFRLDYLPQRNLFLSLRVLTSRKGNNIVDNAGRVLKNVGGDVLLGHFPTDTSTAKNFLDGIRTNSRRIDLIGTYEIVNQLWLDAWYLYESAETPALGTSDVNHTFGVRLRTEF